jgi:hypothetical protein
MFNHKVRPRYLTHEAATVVEIGDWSVAVRLWRPVGRFRDGLVRCPPLAVHKLRGAPPEALLRRARAAAETRPANRA